MLENAWLWRRPSVNLVDGCYKTSTMDGIECALSHQTSAIIGTTAAPTAYLQSWRGALFENRKDSFHSHVTESGVTLALRFKEGQNKWQWKASRKAKRAYSIWRPRRRVRIRVIIIITRTKKNYDLILLTFFVPLIILQQLGVPPTYRNFS